MRHARGWVTFVLMVLATGITGCSSEVETTDDLTQRDRDSILSETAIPGARGVRGALDAQDDAAARAALLDSIAKANPE